MRLHWPSGRQQLMTDVCGSTIILLSLLVAIVAIRTCQLYVLCQMQFYCCNITCLVFVMNSIISEHQSCYCKSSDRSPSRLLVVQLSHIPGLYSRPSLYQNIHFTTNWLIFVHSSRHNTGTIVWNSASGRTILLSER